MKLPIIIKVNDERFKYELCRRFSQKDSWQHYEIHNHDLIYCLTQTFYKKLFIEGELEEGLYTSEDYSTLLRFIRGIGYDIGISQVFGGHYEGKFHSVTDFSVDMTMKDKKFISIPYELKSAKLKNEPKLPYPTHLVQLMFYTAQMKRNIGVLKTFLILADDDVSWATFLYDENIKTLRKTIRYRTDLLVEAFKTGNWKILPKAYFSFYCDGCEACYELRHMKPKEIAEESKSWFKSFIRHQKTLNVEQKNLINRDWRRKGK